jgi:hypothetical protein
MASLALLLLAFALRTFPLDAQSMWRDEVDTLCFARDFWDAVERALGQSSPPTPGLDSPRCQPTAGLSRIDASHGLGSTLRALFTLPGWNGPLYTLAMRPWIELTGASPFALRYSSLLVGLLAVPLTYVTGRRLFDNAAGLLGATLAALSPHLVWYSQEAKMYAAILTLALLAVYSLRRAVDGGGRRRWAATLGATTLALYTHILTALLIPLLVVLALVWWPRTRQHWRGAAAALALLTLPYLPLLAWQARHWLLPAGQGTLFTERRLDVMLESTLSGWGGQFVGEPWAAVILGGLGLLALLGLVWAWLSGIETRDRGMWREPLALLTWALFPLLGIWLISIRQPIFTNRYLIWSAPAFYLLAATGATGLAGRGWWGRLAATGLVALIVTGDGFALHHQSTRPIKPDFRAAAGYLRERYQLGDVIIFHLSYMQTNFDFYFADEYAGWGAPAPGSSMSEAELDFHMHTHTSGYHTVWLVFSEAGMWDPQGRVKAWLDAHAIAPPEERAFMHVSVYRYQLDEGRRTN